MKKYTKAIIVVLILIVSWFYLAGLEFPWQRIGSVVSPTPIPGMMGNGTPTPVPQASISPTTPPSSSAAVLYNVPFSSQAPFGEWSDSRQQDGCEEASAMMAMRWVRGVTVLTQTEAKQEILAISDWEQEKYGSFHDTSADDTVKRIFNEYYEYDNVRARKNVNADDIIKELENGNLVIIPADGRLLGNPYFTAPGPERHMLVVIGYDYSKGEFITNDPGTRSGKNFRYSKKVLFAALGDYPTGDHVPITGRAKNMIVVGK